MQRTRLRRAPIVAVSSQKTFAGRVVGQTRRAADAIVSLGRKLCMSCRINLPPEIGLYQAVKFANTLLGLSSGEKCTLDFSLVRWVEPFGMLVMGAVAQQVMVNKKIILYVSNHKLDRDALSYMAYMGFFDFLGVNHGNPTGMMGRDNRYIPITVIKVNDLQNRANEEMKAIGKVIEEEASKIAKVLSQNISGDLHDTLKYSFSELIRNVVEHSESPVVVYCAQLWPSKHMVEVALLDVGIGIRRSLSQNPYLRIGSDMDALKLALLPGVSGKMFEGRKSDPYDVWENSGFGLYLLHRLSIEGKGSFFIGSGKAGLFIKSLGDRTALSLDGYEGTLVRMQLNTRALTSLQLRIRGLVDEGEKLAKKIKGVALTGAKVSKMLFGSS